jgi:carboxymethylenebutenolidase
MAPRGRRSHLYALTIPVPNKESAVKRLVLLAALVALAPRPAPAQQSSIPDAILGKAPPPQGQAARYLPGDTLTRGYLAVPSGNGPFPALILIHEWNGVVDRVRQVADLFAARGYVTLVADLYQGRIGSTQQENVALMNEARAHPDQVIANLDAAQKFLRARPDVSGKIGVMGWCFGGGIALSYALGGAEHEATAIFYGSLVTDPAQLRRIHHPIYGTFAGQDRGIPPTQVAQFRAVLDSIGIKNDIHVYDPVQHGFWLWVDRDPATSTAPAADAWQRLERFLRETLGGAH